MHSLLVVMYAINIIILILVLKTKNIACEWRVTCKAQTQVVAVFVGHFRNSSTTRKPVDKTLQECNNVFWSYQKTFLHFWQVACSLSKMRWQTIINQAFRATPRRFVHSYITLNLITLAISCNPCKKYVGMNIQQHYLQIFKSK